jgi:hypothetical protein
METAVVFFLPYLQAVYLLPKHDDEKRARDVISEHGSTLGVF